ncbi:enoyl-CoA hydratase [uncultured Neptuniibacter sp.]|uniref:enoyl-CoA hydratase n=1 Tax=uncultured Neptuniibacter sp. TaxID=502143 RepID=UPI002621FE59|nr:enoyl-CoA hydratase [uncultured Neptuniibacter sp.]
MSEALLLRSDSQGICTLTLNRSDAYNALSMELMQAISTELDQIKDDIEVRTVIIKGGGKGFCAGHDLKQMMDAGEEAYYQSTFETCSEMMQRIINLPIPVIAQVHGVATAAGCQLVASCDMAVCADNARFATPGVNIGLFCSTPMVALTRALAPKHAMELLLTGDLMSAERATEIGLVNWSVAAAKLDQLTLELAEKIASKSRKTLSIGKQAFYQQTQQPLSDAYQYCSKVMTDNMMENDAQEGIDAFIGKRKPVWSHR